MNENRVRDLPFQVDESRAFEVADQGGELCEQPREERAPRCAPVRRVARALVSQCRAEAGQDGVMGRLDSVATIGAAQHFFFRLVGTNAALQSSESAGCRRPHQPTSLYLALFFHH